MYSPMKLHPVSYLSRIFKAIKDNIFTIAVAVFFTLKNGIDFRHPDFDGLIFPAILLLTTVISIIMNIVGTMRTSYWIDDDKLFVKSGVFSVRVKEVYISRIQSIEITKNMINQIFGGVIIEIKTPGEGVKLDAVAADSAGELTCFLEHQKELLNEEVEKEKPQQFSQIYELTAKDIMLMSVTSGAMGTVLAAGSGLYFQFDDIFHFTRLLKPLDHLIADEIMTIVAIAAAILIFSYLIGIAVTAIKYFRYQLMYDGERLKIRHGLFEVKEKVIIVDQIQAVSEERSFLRQLFGFTSFKATITSDTAAEEGVEEILGEIEVLPFIKRSQGLSVMRQLVPDYYYEEVDQIIPRRAFRRLVQWKLGVIMAMAAFVQYYFFDKAWIAGLLFIIIILLSGWMKHKYAGYKITADQITVKEVGLFSSKTRLIKEEKLIAIHLLDNYFLRQAELNKVEVQNSAGSLHMTTTLSFIEQDDAEHILSWFMHKEDEQYVKRKS